MSAPTSLTRDSSLYPPLLASIRKPPSRLYCLGDIAALQQPCLAVVGSRSISLYGKSVLQRLIPGLVKGGLTIVSGLAYGIDIEAHRVALQHGGSCIAVLGCGLDCPYPAANQIYKEEIAKTGVVMSEYESTMPALAHQFPERNRIIAGLAQVTLVVEAKERSGSLITARHALEEGRDVCVIPADITRETSAGVLSLLKQGAQPVTCVEDILALFAGLTQLHIPVHLQPALTGSPAALYDLISQGCSAAEDLAQHSGLSPQETQSVLSVLELDGYIIGNGISWQTT